MLKSFARHRQWAVIVVALVDDIADLRFFRWLSLSMVVKPMRKYKTTSGHSHYQLDVHQDSLTTQIDRISTRRWFRVVTVSYTHLTLPTKRIV